MIDFFPKTQHAELSPSSAYRWMNCTASVLLKHEHNLEEPLAGDAAHIGTIAHKLAELVIRGEDLEDIVAHNKKQIDELVGRFKFDLDLMLRNVAYFCHYVMEQNRHTTHVYVEQWLPIITDDTDGTTSSNCVVHGTADIIGYNSHTKDCNIIDFKYGRLPVTPYKNYQMMLYALGTLHNLHQDIEKFSLAIYQPNSIEKNYISSWVLTKDELTYYMQKVRHAVMAILRNEIYYTDNINFCKYCICKAICPHYSTKEIREDGF